MLPVLQIGPLAIQTPGLAMLLALWLGMALAEKHAPQHGLPANKLYNLVFIALMAGIIGARLVYVLQYPAAFLSSPLSLFSLNPGLLNVIGGVLVAGVVSVAYAQRAKLPFWSTLDALTPALAVCMVGLGIAHIASGTAFGASTLLPWGVILWGETRHPTQIYETLAAASILGLLWPGKVRLSIRLPGDTFLHFIALSAAARLLLEAWRGDSILLPGGLRLAQVIAWLIMAACWLVWRARHKQSSQIELQSTCG